jgi:hypothetical protein
MSYDRVSRRVFQTRFGGAEALPEEKGDCFQACVATLLGIPLEDAFDANEAYRRWKSGELGESMRAHWFLQFEDWCELRGFRVLVEQEPIGGVLALAAVASPALRDTEGKPEGHEVLAIGWEVVHDPNERYAERKSYELDPSIGPEFIYLIPRDPGPRNDPLPRLRARPRIDWEGKR